MSSGKRRTWTAARARRAVANRGRRIRKALRRQAAGPTGATPDIVLIFGCQRSGTTMLLDIFDQDLDAMIYRDVGRLTTEDIETSIRLNSLDSVEREFVRCKAPLVVAKPIVESQRSQEILDRFPSARGIWIYRDYRAVAASDLKLFGEDNGIRNLKAIVDGSLKNWRAEGVSREVRATVTSHWSPNMNPYDAAAIFWYARNSLFFEQHLETHNRVQLLRYEDFVRTPAVQRLVRDVHSSSASKGRDLPLSEGVFTLCESLSTRLQVSSSAPR